MKEKGKLWVVEIEINSHCNFRCHYCPVSIQPTIPGFMTRSAFVFLLDRLETPA